MRRTMIIGAISATALTIGLGVSLATADPTPTVPTDMTTMMDTTNGAHMLDSTDMTSMMDDNGMTHMIDANDMASMQTAMHEESSGSVTADRLAACDAGLTSMNGTSMPSPGNVGSGHTAHHPGTQP